MKVTIKITDGKTWNDEIPLEFDLDEARKLWIELGKIFQPPQPLNFAEAFDKYFKEQDRKKLFQERFDNEPSPIEKTGEDCVVNKLID